jgi:hypothetical protein
MPPPTKDRIMAIGHAYREARLLLSAVELGVFSALGAGAAGLAELAERVRIAPRGARDFFDALVAIGLLDRDSQGHYANTPEAAMYLDRAKPTYRGGELEFIGQELYDRWGSLTAALRSGEPQTGAAGASAYQDRYRDPAKLRAFARAMTAATLPVARALAAAGPWREYRTVVDIGAAEGCLLVEVLAAHPHLTGCGFDLAPLQPVFDAYVRAHSLAHKLRFAPGDFFRDPLPDGDVLVMGRVLHNWDLPGKRMLLEKAFGTVHPGGRLIVYERFIDDDRRWNAQALLSSLNMLLMTAGGFDFTAADCAGWMREAGFVDVRTGALSDGHSMIVATK